MKSSKWEKNWSKTLVIISFFKRTQSLVRKKKQIHVSIGLHRSLAKILSVYVLPTLFISLSNIIVQQHNYLKAQTKWKKKKQWTVNHFYCTIPIIIIRMSPDHLLLLRSTDEYLYWKSWITLICRWRIISVAPFRFTRIHTVHGFSGSNNCTMFYRQVFMLLPSENMKKHFYSNAVSYFILIKRIWLVL